MKRRITSILVVLSMALSMMPFFALPASAVAAVAPSGGGTAANPYIIASAGNLVWFRNRVNAGYTSICAYMSADVNLNNEAWTPIAGAGTGRRYTGTFDGRNHVIQGLNISTGKGLVGLFGEGQTCTIKNLHVKGTAVTSNQTCGGIIGQLINGGTLSNCSFAGTVRASQGWVGGIIGRVNVDGGRTNITGCFSSGSVIGGSLVGGIVGTTGAATYITKCASSATLSGSTCGGMNGQPYQSWCYVTDCYFVGTLPASGVRGALCGNNAGQITATRFHYYNTARMGYALTGGGTAVSNPKYVRLLASSGASNATSNAGSCNLSTSQFTSRSNFPTWDFTNVWSLQEGVDAYPVLRESIVKSDNTVITVKDTENANVSISNYFTLIPDWNQYADRFTATITSGATVMKRVLEDEDYVDKEVTLASVSGGTLTIYGSAGMGTYPITLNVVDTKGNVSNFTLDLTVNIRTTVPAPEVLDTEIYYSPYNSLGMINITEGWSFDNPLTCPKDFYTGTYGVSYKCIEGTTAETFASLYDLSALSTAGIAYSYDEASNSIKADIPVKILESETSPLKMNITVLDADYGLGSPMPIANATVTCDFEHEFPEGHVTNTKGQVYAEISPGFKNLTVTAEKYQGKIETVEILGKPNTNAPVVQLVPVRTAYTACDVRERGTDNPIPGAKVSIMKISSEPTLAWNNGANALTVDTKTEFTLPDGFPDGRFQIKNATYGWSHDDVAYMKVENGEYRYYTDAQCTVLAEDQTLASVLHAVKLSEPMYDLRIDKATDGDARHYVATVKLSNIAATYGTFGISWDPELFTFTPATGFHPGAKITGGTKTAEKVYNGADADDYNALGYYGFLWSASDKTDAVLDAELTPVEIATFDFYLKDASLADMLTVDTFSIEPWQDIKAARDWAAAAKAANKNFDPKFWEYWRVCDSDNVRSNLKEGRIDATKSVVNGVETNGFFQAAVNGAIGDDNPASFYDVMTDLQYGFPIKNSVIRFHVTDLYSGDEVEGAKIKLFDDTATKLLQSKNTSYTGRANFTVNTADKTDPRFAYEVTKPGYWPLPPSQLDADRPFVRTTTGKATEVEVQLDKKVYHDTVIVQNEDDEAAQTLELVKSADLGGERYAYNSRDFHFRIKGAKGYRITKYPTKAWVSIGDENAGSTRVIDLELRPSSSGLFTLDGDYLKQDSLSEDYMKNTLHYDDVLPQPDKEGYRSYNIEVKFDKFEVMELDYLVEGMTGAHGKVSYNKATTEYADGLMPFFPDAYVEDTLDTDIKVRTKKSSKDTSTDPATKIPANHKTGTFTFKADDGYMVERVYINGLQTDVYDDLTTFDYTFGDVDMDCSIIVMFWDGETPSTDTILTLVVGDWGYVDALSPKAEEDLICTRRTYLNPTKNLEFTTNAAKFSTDYELYKVEKEIEGEKRVDITDINDGGKYSVEPVEAKNVIAYVTFKNKDADITPTLFVKSYVYSGQGVADPAGILIYNFFDSVEIDLIADSANAWLARGVMLSPYENLDKVSEYEFEEKLPKNTYRYDSLTESIAIGSVFMEKAYPIDGYIDLGQKANVSGAPIRGAVVKFVRLDDTTKQEKKKQVPFMTDSTAVRSNSKFETELPVGWWNVYVMKQGYVTYKITNFYMDKPAQDTDVRHFGHNGSVQQKVVPLIGSTRSGESVTLEDAADVKSGMRKGVSSTVFNMTDVDNSGQIDYIDLAYVWKNYNKYMFEQEYGDFAANGSKDIAAMTTPEAP